MESTVTSHWWKHHRHELNMCKKQALILVSCIVSRAPHYWSSFVLLVLLLLQLREIIGLLNFGINAVVFHALIILPKALNLQPNQSSTNFPAPMHPHQGPVGLCQCRVSCTHCPTTIGPSIVQSCKISSASRLIHVSRSVSGRGIGYSALRSKWSCLLGMVSSPFSIAPLPGGNLLSLSTALCVGTGGKMQAFLPVGLLGLLQQHALWHVCDSTQWLSTCSADIGYALNVKFPDLFNWMNSSDLAS